MARPGPPAPCLEFSELTFTVKQKGGRKTLLQGASGHCRGGLTAVAGPSGSGKTTLLDVLAGDHFGGRVEGRITVDGQDLDLWNATHPAAYVMQHDVLPVLETPREALLTAALLRLPPGMPRQRKVALVDELLQVLDLTSCANLMIGDSSEGLRGLSGGQRRRVTIGIELVKNPSLVLLDEPLSGLDSEMSESVAACLSRLAQAGKTVVMSVHQASGTVQGYIDGLILMAAGRVAFCGRYSDGPAFLQSMGHHPLPTQSPSEFMLAVLSSPEDGAQAAAAYAELGRSASAGAVGCEAAASADSLKLVKASSSAPDLEAGGPGQHQASALCTSAPHVGQLQSSASGAILHRSSSVLRQAAVAAPLWQQTWVLTCRNFRWMWRQRATTLSLLLTSLCSGTLIGLIFYDVGDDLEGGAHDRAALLWMIATMAIFFYSNLAVVGWQRDRQLVRREYGTRLYGMLPFFLARCIRWGAFIPLLSTAFHVYYFLAQLQFTAAKFFINFGCTILTGYTAYLMGTVIAVLAPSGPAAVGIQSAVGVVLVCSNGFLSRDLPIYLRWLQQASFLTYTYTAFILNQFGGLVLWSGGKPVTFEGPPPGLPLPHADWGLGANVAMLAGICGCFCLAALLSLWLMARLRRL